MGLNASLTIACPGSNVMLSHSRSTIMFAVGTTSTQASMRGGCGGGGGGGGGGAMTLRLISTLPGACSVIVISAAVSALPLNRMRRITNNVNSSAAATEAMTHTGTRRRLAIAASAWPCQRGER